LFCYGKIEVMKLIQLDKTVKLLTFFLGFIICSPTFAVEVNDLYQSEVLVTSQSKTDRVAALKKAMRAVVLKVGGQESVLLNPSVKTAINRYNNYITQFHYDRKLKPNKTTGRAQTALYLGAAFNEDKINQLFQQAKLPIWGRLRPQILVWLIEEDGFNRDVLSEGAESSMPEQILSFSKVRGLPLTLPLMDLDDALTLSVSDLWGRFSEPTKQMSSRYMSDAILIIRSSNSSLLDNTDDQFDGGGNEEKMIEENCTVVLCEQPVKVAPQYVMDWSLVSQNQLFSESYQGEDKNVLLAQVLSDVSNNIYQRYALSTGLNNEYVIDVANIAGLSDYVAVMRFLNDLSSVEAATLVEVSGDNRRIKLKLLGSRQVLLASLELNNQLKQYIDPLNVPSIDDIPVFYWERK